MVRRALHSSHPENLLCREDEIVEISSFLQSHLTKGKPGSLYISGAPGTGKTACLTKIMFEMKVSMLRGLFHCHICQSSTSQLILLVDLVSLIFFFFNITVNTYVLVFNNKGDHKSNQITENPIFNVGF